MSLLLILVLQSAPSEAGTRRGAIALAEPKPDWVWRHDPTDTSRVKIRLIRGSALIVRRPGDFLVEMRVSSASKRRSVSFAVHQGDREVVIADRYPARAAMLSHAECLPPVDERGDFWKSDETTQAVIYSPMNVQVEVEIFECINDPDREFCDGRVKERISVH